MEFLEGWGGGQFEKKPSVGGVWIFCGTTKLTVGFQPMTRPVDGEYDV